MTARSIQDHCTIAAAWLTENSRYPHYKGGSVVERSTAASVALARRAYRDGTLPDDQISRMEAVPLWIWKPKRSAPYFERKAADMAAWLTNHGRYPNSRSEDDHEAVLGRWVLSVRNEHRQSLMSDERRSVVEAIPGWQW